MLIRGKEQGYAKKQKCYVSGDNGEPRLVKEENFAWIAVVMSKLKTSNR